MRLTQFCIAVTLLAASPLCSASNSYVVPTTTLAAQTANNTSAANRFTTQSNDNRGAGNISKVDVHTLLYSGAPTKVYAHMVLWFGQSNHMNIGYSETDAAQVQNQIGDMVSRGIDGAIIDWYGPGNSIDQATQLVMAAAESHPGFTFSIMIDQGAIEWYSCQGCSPQQALVNDLQYIEKTYFSSPAYMTIQGQPVVTNFNVSLSYPSVDWNAANASLSTHPAYIFQNNNGFTAPLTDGSYSWVMPTTTDYGMSYLTSFYDAGISYPNEQTVGATYKGFNDTLASWGSNRIMGQQCGQTWLQTFSELNRIYSAGKQLPYLQLVTWNDYEEATEIESGIDNCLTLSASVPANNLQWVVNGNENTVDHYTVYISTDGQNLMPLTDIATGVHSLNLCGFPIPGGNYQMFVQAVGKPTLANQISDAMAYRPSCSSTTPPAPVPVSFSAAPATITIPSGMSGTFTVAATAQSGTFSSPISLTCTGLPSTWSCTFSPAVLTPAGSTATSVLTISTVAVAGMDRQKQGKNLPFYATWLLPFGLVGVGLFGKGTRRRGMLVLALCSVISLGMVGASCGGKTGGAETVALPTKTAVTPTTYSVTINGSSNATKLSTTVNVIVQ
ncbi:MAG: hypothetical protein WB762_06505 [Candidatus Sulfotelmatobacter sp.]